MSASRKFCAEAINGSRLTIPDSALKPLNESGESEEIGERFFERLPVRPALKPLNESVESEESGERFFERFPEILR